jgi:hypothetical protein
MRVCSTPKTNSRGSECLHHAPKHASVLRIPRFLCLSLEPDKHDLGTYVSRERSFLRHAGPSTGHRRHQPFKPDFCCDDRTTQRQALRCRYAPYTHCLESRMTSGIGKAPLGFLNPWLYKNAGMLNDIKDGEFRTLFPISPILTCRSRFHDRRHVWQGYRLQGWLWLGPCAQLLSRSHRAHADAVMLFFR